MNLQRLTIERIEIEQFKKIRDLTVSPEKGANIFFGSFRSGKTSLCEFIQFALYGADSVSLARGNTEDAKGKIFFSSEKGNFVVERQLIGGEESVLFYKDSPAEPIATSLTPGEYLTEMDQDSFDLISYFRQAKYETPVVKPKFSILNHIASFSPETESIYRDLLVLDKKRNQFCNSEKNGTLDILLDKEVRLKKELEEHPDWEKEASDCLEALSEIREKIDDNDRRCVLIKADMAGFADDLKLSQNKENTEETFHKIVAKEKRFKIASFEVSSKIGKLSRNELEEMKNDYNRLSLAVANLNKARISLASAEENLAYHESIFTGKNSLENLLETKEKIKKQKNAKLLLYILGILFLSAGIALGVLLHYFNFDLITCIASCLALVLCSVSSFSVSTLFKARIRNLFSMHETDSLPEFYRLYEKVAAHDKTKEVYREEVFIAENLCRERIAEKDAIQEKIAGKVKSLGYSEEDGELLAVCDEIIEANDALFDLEDEIENDKIEYKKKLCENVDGEKMTLSPEFVSLQKELAFLSAQNDALYKKKALISARLQEAKEKSARNPEDIKADLEKIGAAISEEKSAFEGVDLNFSLAKARKDQFESDLKKALSKHINEQTAHLLGEGESFLFDDDFELCFCDRKSVLPLIAAGGGVISEMGLLAFRLSLAKLLKKTCLPMIFDDSLAKLSQENAKKFYDYIRENCCQFFIATSSEELLDISRDTANIVTL